MDDPLKEKLFIAYYDARRNKRNKLSQLSFERNYESNLLRLYEDIRDRQYELQPSICFIVNDPVKREVFAANFRDRVVHHLIYNDIWRIFDRQFIFDSYSCRPGKGTLFGVHRLEHFIRSCTNNYNRVDGFILKLDIQGYFMSIDRALLYEKVMKGLKTPGNQNVLDLNLMEFLISKVIFNDPTQGCRIRGRKSDWRGLPPSKSLFYAMPGKGLPIGNLTSQLFSNIYLNELDQFVKRELKIRFYGRYVDDFFLIHPDKNYLIQCRGWIKQFLTEKLFLTLHPRKIYLQHYSKGVKFLGVMIKPYRSYVDRRIVHQFRQKMSCSYQNCFDDESSVQSYLGLFEHHNSFLLLKRMGFKRREDG